MAHPRARTRRPPKAVTHLRDLTPDPRNARRHTPRNIGLIVDALHEVGAARSIVIDERGVVLAGNATVEAAAEAGITKVRVVEADGQEIVAVRRSGLSAAAKTRLALYDNRAAELAEGWDAETLRGLQADAISLEGLWTQKELADLLASEDDTTRADRPSERPRAQYLVVITCDTDADQRAVLERCLAEGLRCHALIA